MRGPTRSRHRVDIAFIAPGLLETNSSRGGGAEITDYGVAKVLSKTFRVALVSPYFPSYRGEVLLEPNLVDLELPLRATASFPPSSLLETGVWTAYSFIMSIITSLYLVGLARRGLRLLVVHNPPSGLVPMLLGKAMGLKVVLSEGNTVPWVNPYLGETKSGLLQTAWRSISLRLLVMMCLGADAIRAQSLSIREGMRARGVAPEKVFVIPAGVDTHEFERTTPSGSNPDTFRIAYVGRLVQEKNANLLQEVVESLAALAPDVRFRIFGDGPLRPTVEFMPNVESLGYVPRSQLPSELAAVDAVVSFQKELGRGEIEAMAAGKVLFACNAGEVSDILTDNKNAVLCTPNARSFVERIIEIRGDPDRRRLISEAGRDLVRLAYSWGDTGSQWMALCTSLGNTRTNHMGSK